MLLVYISCSFSSNQFLRSGTDNVTVHAQVCGLFCVFFMIMYQSNRSFNIPPPPGIPRAFDVFSCPGGGNLINLIFPGVGIWSLLIGHYRNVRGLGKSMVVFRLFEKLRYSNERSTIFLESLQRIEVFGGGKWQNGSSTNITQNREFVWIG